jgi:hypothetical protein
MSETIYRFVRTFADPTRIRIENEFSVKKRMQNPVNRMVNKPVAHASLVNISRFRIIYFESLIRFMPISFVHQFAMQNKNIIQQID